MRRPRIVVALLAGVLTVGACGDDKGLDVGTAGGNDGTPASQSGSVSNADFPSAAASGTGTLEIDGMTFTGPTSGCEISDDYAVFNVELEDGGTTVGFGGQVFDADNGLVTVMFDFEQVYVSNAGDGWGVELDASVAVDGSTLFWAGAFSVTEDYLDTGEIVQGRLSVTC
jgi:hypothetical protein